MQEEVSGTLATGNDQTIIEVDDATVYAIDRAATPKFSEGVCHTLRHGGAGGCNDAVAFAQNTRDEVRYVNGDGSISGALAANPGMKQTSHVIDGPVARRLTPRECERLQGMPDDWTSIPYRGKPAEDCPDGPRYKAIGNSMAVPVMRWIGERIAMVDRVEVGA